MPTNEALDRAREAGLDLVEVAPNVRPPVCRILDYGKFKYDQSKKEKKAKKKQQSFQMKEMRFRPKIDDHDFNFKTKHVREFLESGNKVKVFVMFRGREMAYTEQGKDLLDKVAEVLGDISQVESPAKLEGRNMSMVLGPTKDTMKKLRDDEEKKEKAKADSDAEKEPSSESNEE